MSYFDTDPRAQADLLERARQSPVLMPGAGVFEGAGTATYKGLLQGVIAQPALLLGDAVTPTLRPVASAIDNLFGGTTANDWLTGEQRKTVTAVRDLMPGDDVGLAGQLGYGLTSTLPGAIAGTIAAGPGGGAAVAGSLTGYSSFRVAQEKGVDTATAFGQGTIEGAAMAAGVLLPGSVGTSILKSIGVGVGGNVGLGVVQRGAVGSLLEANGYPEMAKQYQAFDLESIAVDAVLGGAFGVLGASTNAGARTPAGVPVTDAALAAKAKQHLEIETAPGVPVDPASRSAHSKAITKAIEDIANDRPVDVSRTGVAEAEFLGTRTEVQAAVRTVVEDLAPLGRVLDEVETLRAQVRALGLEAPDEPMFTGAPVRAAEMPATPQPATVWYSGAPVGLTELDPALARAGNRYGRGVYLGTDAGFTETYSRGQLDSTGARGQGGATYEATFAPVKPFNADAVMPRADAERVLTDAGATVAQIRELLGAKPKVGGSTVFDALTKLKGDRDGASEALVAQGYDAVLFKDNRGAQLAVSYGKVPVRESTAAPKPAEAKAVVSEVFGEKALALVDDHIESLALVAKEVDGARAEMERGTLPERDITPHLDAALELVPLVRDGRSVDSIVDGTDLFSQPAGPESLALLRAVESGKDLGDVMARYTDNVRKQGNPQLADTFDAPSPSRAALLAAAIDEKPVKVDREAKAVAERDSGAELELVPIEKPADPISEADTAAVAQVMESTPNAHVMDDDGQMRVAAVALAEADATIKQAESDAAAFPAAVSCFLRG
ncbi:MAG: hypothetical protein K0Q92_665 [Steroidobacteraceae bacterium]|jgi:hypothetical protein|nr:hypothetical protein [Steroidobacteraceae bacterium]